ncbi:MAG: hypothetical protein EXS42_01565 [Lacunisphaera sp.]|nr:hypothetical protein [Lacunisphaera sp.]
MKRDGISRLRAGRSASGRGGSSWSMFTREGTRILSTRSAETKRGVLTSFYSRVKGQHEESVLPAAVVADNWVEEV